MHKFSPCRSVQILRYFQAFLHTQHVWAIPPHFQSFSSQGTVRATPKDSGCFSWSSPWWILSPLLDHCPVVEVSLFSALFSRLRLHDFCIQHLMIFRGIFPLSMLGFLCHWLPHNLKTEYFFTPLLYSCQGGSFLQMMLNFFLQTHL